MQFKPTKVDMDRFLTGLAGDCEREMLRWRLFAEKMDTLLDADLTAMGYTEAQLPYIRSFCAALKNIELRYRNQAPLNSDDPSYFVKEMSRFIIL